ncbi:MAG: RHS repeat-associated core domain-containing protein [Candidatus Thiodiazotropha sp.]
MVEYQYDWQGSRTAKIVNGVKTNYIVDSNRPLPAVLMETDGNGQVIASYTYGPTSYLPISQTRNGETYFYHYDGLDNVRMLTDSSGNVATEYYYDSQGNLLFAIGSIENNFLFGGQQYDHDAGLYYHRARYRDTNTGRFTQMDQYAGRMQEPHTLHKYNYAHNDPINLSDPSGKFSIGQVMTAVNVVANLTTSAITGYRIGQFVTGERELTAKEIGFTVLIAAGGSAASKLINLIAKTKKAKNVLSALENASATAYKAAKGVKNWVPKNKHMRTTTAKGKARFNTDSDDQVRQWVADALRSPRAQFRPNGDSTDTFRMVVDMGIEVGIKGQRKIRVIVREDGRILNAFPVHNL